MNVTFYDKFPKQLGHWSIHGLCNALPSFIIAGLLLNLWQNPQAILAMLMAIGVFIVAFAVMTSLDTPFGNPSHLLGRAVRLGAAIRSWIAGLSLLLLPLGLPNGSPTFFLIPDFWCGWAALVIQGFIVKAAGIQDVSQYVLSVDSPEKASFLPVFTTTMLEGFIISFLLLMISFFCVIFLQAKERRRMLKDLGKAVDPSV